MAIEAKISTAVKLEDGLHTGKIGRFEQRISKEGWNYLDMNIDIDGSEIKLKAGFPLSLAVDTKLGKFLMSMGINVAELTTKKTGSVDIEKHLKTLEGKRIQFMTLNEKTARGEFARVVEGSIRLVK